MVCAMEHVCRSIYLYNWKQTSEKIPIQRVDLFPTNSGLPFKYQRWQF